MAYAVNKLALSRKLLRRMTLDGSRLYSPEVAPGKDGREQWDGARLKELREAQGLSQTELTDAAGVGASELSRHETNKGTSNPTVAVLGRLARALKVPLYALFEPVGSAIPRPEDEAGPRDGYPLIDRILATLDAETPAEESWRGDVLKAVAVLNRALRRSEAASQASPFHEKDRRPGKRRSNNPDESHGQPRANRRSR